MKRLLEVISNKVRWSQLRSEIEELEKNRIDNPSKCIDNSKTIVESIAKTILSDKGISFRSDSDFGPLTKMAFESLSLTQKLKTKDATLAVQILQGIVTITKNIGEYRNNYGVYSHGQDLESEKFDKYLLELCIGACDVIASFLIVAHGEDFRDRARLYYEENEEFNKYLDETTDLIEIKGIQIIPSKSLYSSDQEAYREEFLSFVNEKEVIIHELEHSNNFVTTRKNCQLLIILREYLTIDEVIRILRAGYKNSQIYLILGGGYTKGLYNWIIKEHSTAVSESDLRKLNEAFAKCIY